MAHQLRHIEPGIVYEAVRRTRGGRFAFNMTSPLLDLCWDDATDGVSERLQRPYFGMHRFDEPDTVSFNFDLNTIGAASWNGPRAVVLAVRRRSLRKRPQRDRSAAWRPRTLRASCIGTSSRRTSSSAAGPAACVRRSPTSASRAPRRWAPMAPAS